MEPLTPGNSSWHQLYEVSCLKATRRRGSKGEGKRRLEKEKARVRVRARAREKARNKNTNRADNECQGECQGRAGHPKHFHYHPRLSSLTTQIPDTHEGASSWGSVTSTLSTTHFRVRVEGARVGTRACKMIWSPSVCLVKCTSSR